jgi:hypothetical protein
MNQSSPVDPNQLIGIPRDTTPEAFWIQCEALRNLGVAGRLRLAFDLTQQVWNTVEAGIRRRHPEWSDDQVRMMVVRMRLGEDLFRIGFPAQEAKT